MSNRYVIEALLRPAVELNTAVVSGMAAYVCVQAPWAVALAPTVSYVTAAGFAALAVTRTHQGMKIIRYRRNLRRLTRYVMSTKQIPVSHRRLFLGRGFRWTQKHTQRLQDTLRPEVARYLQPNRFYLGARQLEMMTEHRLPWLGKLLSADTPLNPVRPLPPVGGNPALHGIEPDEKDVTLALGERVGHTVVYGTTRVGKTRLAELLVSWTRFRRRLNGPAWRLHRPTRLTVAAFSLITVRPHPISTPSAAALTAIWSPPARNRVTRLLWPVITGGSGPDAHDIRTNERV